MPRRPRPLTEHDLAIWRAYARDVRVLPGRAPMTQSAGAKLAPVEEPPMLPPPQPRLLKLRHAASTLVTGIHPPGLDRSSWHRFQSGRLIPSRTLDLHGKTASAAFQSLERFLHSAAADHIRCVEVITGRGSGEAGGVIRRELPLWLNRPDLRPLILAAAHPHPLNPGSTRLLLRRSR